MTSNSCRLLVVLSALSFSFLTPCDAVAQVVTREYQIKAGFLVLLVDFVSWPGEQKPGVDVPLKIGVVGSDPFQVTLQDGRMVNYLDLKVAERNRQGKRILVKRFVSAEVDDDCHIVFISPLAAAGSKETTPLERLEAMKKRTAGQALLLVSDVAGLAQHGSVVNLVVNQKTNRVQIEINPLAAKRASLSIDPQLLRVANIVRGANDQRGGSLDPLSRQVKLTSSERDR